VRFEIPCEFVGIAAIAVVLIYVTVSGADLGVKFESFFMSVTDDVTGLCNK
jgi:hypothetical protein